MYASGDRNRMANSVLLLLALALTGALTAPARAQAPSDGRWTAWLGCWQPADTGVPSGAGQLCIFSAPGAPGVTFANVVGGNVVSQHEIIADGRPHPVAESGCRGTETFEWSNDGRRLFHRTEMSCDGGTRRSTSGVLAFLPNERWVDIEAAGQKASQGVRIQHYGRWTALPAVADKLPKGEDLAIQNARAVGGEPLTLEQVLEANQKLDPVVLQNLVFERHNGFALNSRVLTQLADARVPSDVIDLMVALTWPEQFSIQGGIARMNPRADTSRSGRGGYAGNGPAGWCYDNYGYYRSYRPWAMTSWSLGFPFYPGYYGYYYDPCYGGGYGPYGGGYYGPWGGYYGPYGGVVIVRNNGDNNNNTGPGNGTYTGRTAHRRPEGGSSSGNVGGRSANPSSGSAGGSSSSGGGSSSAGGGSSSGGGDGGGRTAHPRRSGSTISHYVPTPVSSGRTFYSPPAQSYPAGSSSGSSVSAASSSQGSATSAVSSGTTSSGEGRFAHAR